MNVYHHGNGDLYEIAAGYAYHIAESQAFLGGNKRTAVRAALVFLEGNDIDTRRLPELVTYEAMIKVASHEMDRRGLAEFFHKALSREVNT
jgi:death on curing protein